MKRSRSFSLILLASVFMLATLNAQSIVQTSANSSSPAELKTSQVGRLGSLNINNLWLQAGNDGRIGFDSTNRVGSTGPYLGLTYPMNLGTLLYADHPYWGGMVHDGVEPLIRVGGGTYAAGVGVRPGAIISKGIAEDPHSDGVRVYRFRPDYLDADLTLDVAASFGISTSSVTSDMVSALREEYKRDLAEWPWKKGAPFVDKNHNGVMDPGELPGLQNASQVLWLSYNDLDPTATNAFSGFPPIGLEVQVTLWAYKGSPNLEDVAFKRYRILYKGTALTPAASRIDSMYLTQWVDPDIGDASDDLGGCDSTLDLAYAYNRKYNGNDQDRIYQALGLPTPGLGYVLLQGPLVPELGSTGVYDFATRGDFRNLHMSSCGVHITGLGDGLNEVIGTRSYYYWNVARGFQPLGNNQTISTTPWLDYQRIPSKYMYSGEPDARTGWIAARPTYLYYPPTELNSTDFPGGDVRLYLNSGPFSMMLGETQEVVFAVIASPAPTSAENAMWLKRRAEYVRSIYPNLGDYAAEFVSGIAGQNGVATEFMLGQNYPNPFNPSTIISYSIPNSGQTSLAVFDLLGREIASLREGFQSAGSYEIRWNGVDSQNHPVPSGMYFYRLVNGTQQLTKKMLLLR